MSKTKEIPAKGQKAFLIRTLDGLMIRQYSSDKKTFTDYEIAHYDLQITIDDDFASFYQGKHNYIDYSSEVFGKGRKDKK